MKILWFLAVSAAVGATFVAAWVLTAVFIEWYSRPRPTIPAGYVVLGERLMSCGTFLPRAYGQVYGLPYREYGDLVVYGLVDLIPESGVHYRAPIIWVFYPNDNKPHVLAESTYRIITLPGKAPEYVAPEELRARFPKGPCTAVEQVNAERHEPQPTQPPEPEQPACRIDESRRPSTGMGLAPGTKTEKPYTPSPDAQP